MRHLPTAFAAVLVLAACSGDNDGDQAFCDDLGDTRDQLTDLAATAGADPDSLAAAVDDLDALDPPDEIADAYQQVIDAYTAVADTGSITDPDIAGRLADAQTAAAEIDAYVRQECATEG
jgi:hypothetical protein